MIELVTSWITLMRYARELGEARMFGDEKEIKKAQENHDNYVQMCLKADRMIGLNYPNFNQIGE